MAERLRDAASPYLRAHADNPVDWWPWGAEAFAEAARRDVPVLVSIGYASCHWCHVMARESFSDPGIAAILDAGFVAIKVDREEHAEVDARYMAVASAFTAELGWPLTAFATPAGRVFFAGSYYPPEPIGSRASFRQVLAAVSQAWHERRSDVEATGEAVAEALARIPAPVASPLPGDAELDAAVAMLEEQEDHEHGGFGRGAKFPALPVLSFLVARGASLGERHLDAVSAGLVDPVDGGVWRYATRPDWRDPHYERMLYDTAQLLGIAARTGRGDLARRLAGYLLGTLRLPGGGFASAQDSESVIGGHRVEGGWHRLDADGRAAVAPPALDDKLLTGWNGLAIAALARAGARFARPEWVAAAAEAADAVLARHGGGAGGGARGAGGEAVHGGDGGLVRMSVDGVVSDAPAELDDYGLLAVGLLDLAEASGQVDYAIRARELVDACLAVGEPFAAPAGGDPVLATQGLAAPPELSDSDLPSGWSALTDAAARLAELSSEPRYREAAERGVALAAGPALEHPFGYGALLAVATRLTADGRRIVVVDGGGEGDLVSLAREHGGVVVDPAEALAWAEAGFDLFEGRTTVPGVSTAYLCEGFVCRLPATTVAELSAQLTTR